MDGLEPIVFVGQVAGWKRTGEGEITIDSAAEESVCPEGWEKQFGTRPVGPGGEMKFGNGEWWKDETLWFEVGELHGS